MSQSQSLQITSRLSSHPLEVGLRRPSAVLLVACILVYIAEMLRAEGLRLAVFDVDATPPVGSMMAYDPVKAQGELGLRGRGVIVLGAGKYNDGSHAYEQGGYETGLRASNVTPDVLIHKSSLASAVGVS